MKKNSLNYIPCYGVQMRIIYHETGKNVIELKTELFFYPAQAIKMNETNPNKMHNK